ncbi:uncharacterized protein LOC123533519 [Mercenaria mercenaria]|uniref:uncharacterized protein LOC123533519 n=1 Tax=Mercenaria mercenaria TaxID=6596 RepID=UPI00234F532E|nr:uncharacterized protein LOC123533519 [Mercenaria mercenaria]
MSHFGKVYINFMLLMFVPSATARTRRYSKFDVSNVRYMDILQLHLSTPRVQCVALCDGTEGCSSVNHNSDTDRCELAAHIPRVLAPTTVTETNWMIYYHDPLIRGVNAWQNSTYVDGHQVFLTADLAIDGNYANIPAAHGLPCAHTDNPYSYWAMEFERFAEVSYANIYFRSDSLNNRNSNIRLLISTTRFDSDNNLGTDCATYVGPPQQPALPVKITCTRPQNISKTNDDNDDVMTDDDDDDADDDDCGDDIDNSGDNESDDCDDDVNDDFDGNDNDDYLVLFGDAGDSNGGDKNADDDYCCGCDDGGGGGCGDDDGDDDD